MWWIPDCFDEGGDTFASTNKWLDTLSTFWFGWGCTHSFNQSGVSKANGELWTPVLQVPGYAREEGGPLMATSMIQYDDDVMGVVVVGRLRRERNGEGLRKGGV